MNPIDFENAEGNLGLANSLFDHMAQKVRFLPRKRNRNKGGQKTQKKQNTEYDFFLA